MMHLYKLTNIMNNDYDTFDAIIVAANSPEEARQLIPTVAYSDSSVAVYNPNDKSQQSKLKREWTTPENVIVEFVGELDQTFFKNNDNNPLILASFNAG